MVKSLTEIKKDCKEDLGRELTITEDILIKLVFVYSQKALLEQAQEFEKMINDWYIKTREKKTYVDLSDVQELLKEVRGDKK